MQALAAEFSGWGRKSRKRFGLRDFRASLQAAQCPLSASSRWFQMSKDVRIARYPSPFRSFEVPCHSLFAGAMLRDHLPPVHKAREPELRNLTTDLPQPGAR